MFLTDVLPGCYSKIIDCFGPIADIEVWLGLARCPTSGNDPKQTLGDVPSAEAQQRHTGFLCKAADGKSSRH
jgi:hypothetical protein